MKYARKRWLKMAALCLGLTEPAWGQAVIFPDTGVVPESIDSEGSVIVADDGATVRMGRSPSGSISAPPATVQQSQYVASPEQYLGSVPPMFPNATAPMDDGVGFANTSPLDRILWRAGRVNMDQYGIQGGYTSLNAFVPLAIESDSALWFTNPRVNIDDYGRGGFSWGLGRRFYVPDEDRVYGASFWWDYDAGHMSEYHQLGGSFESIGQYFSLRGNFSIPTGDTTTNFGAVNGATQFVGNQITVLRTYFQEKAYASYDTEITTPLPLLGRYGFDLGLGAYYLGADRADDTAGFSSRIQAQITEDFWMNGIYTYDSIFKSNFSLNFELTMPDGMPSRWFRRAPVSSYLTQSVLRRYRVPVARQSTTSDVVVTAPNGDDFVIAVIDPNYIPAPGVTPDGSFANPFPSVAAYMANAPDVRDDFNLIYVRRRNDASDTNLNTTISLLDAQALFGDGDLPSGGRPTINTSVGVITLPGTSGALPLLTNSAAAGMDVITLANMNEVGGFTIDAGNTASGIAGANIDGFNIHDTVMRNVVHGIHITSDTSPIFGSSSENYGIISNNTITGSGFGANAGISLEHTDGLLNLLISNNTITGFRGEDTNGNGVLNSGEDKDGDLLLDRGYGVHVVANGAGAEINANNYTSTTAPTGILSNVVTGNGTGVKVEANNSSLVTAALTGNQFNNNLDADGAGFVGSAGSNGNLTMNAFFSNSFNNNVGDGVQLLSFTGGTVNLTDNEDADNDGILDAGEDANGNGRLDLGFANNSMIGNDNNGFYVNADGVGSTVTAFIGSIGSGNVISDNGRLETVGNTTTARGNGVYLTTGAGGEVNGAIDGNLISRNAQSGITIAPDAGVVNLSSISGNTITNNGLVNGNPLPAGVTGGDAIVYAPSNGGSFSVTSFNNNIIQLNRGATIRVSGNGGIVNLGTIENTIFDRSVVGTEGIVFDVDNATITGVVRNNIFLGSTNNANLSFGIGGEVRGGTIDLAIQNNLFDTNAEAGIGFVFDNSNNVVPPTPGTPIGGEGAQASLLITGNEFIRTYDSAGTEFNGSAIAIHMRGEQTDVGVPPVDPTNVTPTASRLEAVIAENLIGSLTDVSRGNAGSGIDIQVGGDTAIADLAGIGSPIDNPLFGGVIIGTDAGLPYAGNIIANNQLNGVTINRTQNAAIDNLSIGGNIIQNNLGDGISIDASGGGLLYGVPSVLNFEVSGNQIVRNGFLSDGTAADPFDGRGRGIQMRAGNDVVQGIDITNNLISNNRLSGIEARTYTNSHSFWDSTYTTRDSLLSASTVGSNAVIFGNWSENIITANGYLDPDDRTAANSRAGHGIALGRVDMIDPDNPAEIIEGFNNGGYMIGGSPVLLTIDNNDISSNALDGIHVYLDKTQAFSTVTGTTRTTLIDITNNNISLNGNNGLAVHATTFSTSSVFNFNQNIVDGNGVYSGLDTVSQAGGNVVGVIGDGIEITTGAGSTLVFNAAQNRITNNAGRGANLLTALSAYSTYNFNENYISGNSREGFYLINAPFYEQVLNRQGLQQGIYNSGYTTDSWLADFDSNHEMFNYGHFYGPAVTEAGNDPPPAILAPFFINYNQNVQFAAPVTDLVFTNNIVDNNGGVVPDSDGEDPYTTIGGFVLRVGTSTQDQSVVYPTPSVPNPYIAGGVRALVTGNRMSGNYGADVYMDGFVATEAPNVSVLPDPLIRIDLVFENNRGGSIDVGGTNFQVFYENTGPTLGGGTNVKRPNPPFADADVLRDATRDLGDLGIGIFPGFGLPTLRIEENGSAPDAFGNYIGNNLFNVIYSDFNPFQWQSMPDGTLLPVPPFPVY
ncbi:beta strand repeat-containing protein [Planctomicrobium sp. SH664]|uniref:beta strand repeat-containing protein n=1 Tax=Planctomicrobium sp. SH664 TaxID=3448125 RepID=UPI003F5CB606